MASKSSVFRNWLKSDLIAKMPHFLQNKNQLTCEEVNESSVPTSVRRAAEVINDLIKKVESFRPSNIKFASVIIGDCLHYLGVCNVFDHLESSKIMMLTLFLKE